jgi:hypothetical protein
MRYRFLILVSLLVLSPILQAKERAVAPGQRFPGPILNIRAPNSEGWKLLDSSSNGVAFGRSGTSSAESFIAAVIRIQLPEGQSKEEFAALVKHAVEEDSPPSRFRNIESTFEDFDERGYPCILYKGVAEDTKAKTSFLGRKRLILQVQSLYCRPPNMEKAGFAAIFSHRGAATIDDFDAQASDFIKEIQARNSEPNNSIEHAHDP